MKDFDFISNSTWIGMVAGLLFFWLPAHAAGCVYSDFLFTCEGGVHILFKNDDPREEYAFRDQDARLISNQLAQLPINQLKTLQVIHAQPYVRFPETAEWTSDGFILRLLPIATRDNPFAAGVPFAFYPGAGMMNSIAAHVYDDMLTDNERAEWNSLADGSSELFRLEYFLWASMSESPMSYALRYAQDGNPDVMAVTLTMASYFAAQGENKVHFYVQSVDGSGTTVIEDQPRRLQIIKDHLVLGDVTFDFRGSMITGAKLADGKEVTFPVPVELPASAWDRFRRTTRHRRTGRERILLNPRLIPRTPPELFRPVTSSQSPDQNYVPLMSSKGQKILLQMKVPIVQDPGGLSTYMPSPHDISVSAP